MKILFFPPQVTVWMDLVSVLKGNWTQITASALMIPFATCIVKWPKRPNLANAKVNMDGIVSALIVTTKTNLMVALIKNSETEY
jgi:putative effector of murein hydrolase LrgA (UPF0299 family)